MRSTLTALLLMATLGAANPAGGAKTASLDLLARAANPNPTLNSYTASAQLSALLRAVIPIHKTFSGRVYYLRPNRKIEFTDVPSSLSKFRDLISTTPTYEQMMAQYTIAPMTDDGTSSSYTLVPKKAGSRVKSVMVTVTDQTALLSKAQWSYTNGGSLGWQQSYTDVGTYRLPAKAVISAHFPGYSVDGTLTFGNYQPNAVVSPSVFASPSS
jgi:hypothetical protein